MAGIANDITGAGEVATAVGGIAKTTEDFLFRVFPSLDKEQGVKFAQDLEFKLLDVQAQNAASQVEVNKVEAGSVDRWSSGWRPGIGWCCALGVFWQFFLAPLIIYVAALAGSGVKLPVIGGDALNTLTFAILGIVGAHSYDKAQGTAAPNIPVVTTKIVRPALPVK